ncbi:MAG: hypothetical protein B7X04_02655 [Parcubacteria group bacterium 21-54-25]|nr:MAG: hypothetical protein B7X04_02655 [Parcubacteria group bacterium 21-54-25]HQU07747.1 hypothetical protein [Candidatus Paceibacterota bacterium]
MRAASSKKILALLLIVAFTAPASLLVAPQRAHAFLGFGDTIVKIGDYAKTTFLSIAKETISAVANVSSSAATVALEVDKYVLQPLAFELSGKILKSMTSDVIGFINGKTNGTGQPQYVQNLRGYEQTVNDGQVRPFISEFQSSSNSQFAPQIAASLYQDYTQNSSLAGFFAQNQDTLGNASPNPQAFVSGSFRGNGGWNAWFSLTTECQNDPYCLQYRAQNELASLTQNATQAGLAALNWGNGFLSWCGGSAPSSSSSKGGSAPTVGTAPGDACTKADGSPGTILTPGSVIKDQLQNVENANIIKVTQLGSLGGEVTRILGNIGTVMQTVNLASNILGGSGNSGGFSGIGQPSGSGGGSALSQYANAPGYLGVTSAGVAQSAGASFAASLQQITANVNQYESDWNTIANSATSASSALHKIISSCTSTSTRDTASTALQVEVAPVLSNAATAFSDISTTRVLIQKVQADVNGTGNGATYPEDLQALQTAPPTAQDLAQATQDSIVQNAATSSPSSPLTVSGGSLADQMNRIAQNASTILSSCVVATATTTKP